MPTLVWDATGERSYQLGVSHGVLYLKNGTSTVWNGLVSVEADSEESDLISYYIDGVKHLQILTPGEFSGKLTAITYPDELDQLLGVVDVEPGLSFHEQPPQSFDLSYRTRLGNDLNPNAGYKIHLLYNILAQPDAVTYETLSDEIAPSEFSWSLTGTPPSVAGYRPTVHVSVDSTKTDPDVLAAIEHILYGSDESNVARMPSPTELKTLFDAFGVLVVNDNGDGTWTAIDLADDYITIDSPTEFTITGADATYLDPETYEVSTTYP